MMEKSRTTIQKSAGNAAKSATTALQKAGSAVGVRREDILEVPVVVFLKLLTTVVLALDGASRLDRCR